MRLILTIALAAIAHTAAAAAVPDALAPYSGKMIYLDFWASWCGPCAQSFPWLNEMQSKYGSRIAFVGVDVDADRWAGSHFLASHHADFAILPDPAGQLAQRYALDGMPSTIILDADGRVLHRHVGFHPNKVDAYEAAIVSALNHAAPAPSP